MKKITWHKLQQKRGKIKKTSRREKFFTAISIFNALALIIGFLFIRANTEIFYEDIINANYFEKAISSLEYTNYTDTSESIIFLINQTCKFDEFNYSPDDVFCVANETNYFLINKANVFDYNGDGIFDCKDNTISLIYILRKFGINAWPVLTDRHVLALVEFDPYFYAFVDPSYGGFEAMYLEDFIYGKLNR